MVGMQWAYRREMQFQKETAKPFFPKNLSFQY